MKIVDLKVRPIINSEGKWSTEVWLNLKNGLNGTASAPQGISTGEEEKKDLDGRRAAKIIENKIRRPLFKLDNLDQKSLDDFLLADSSWPSSATLAISAAFAKATGFFKSRSPKMPKLMMLVFEGEEHGNPRLTIQEFMVVVDKIEKGIDFYQKVKSYLEKKKILTTVGSEGGFSPEKLTDTGILEILKKLGASKIALDIAGNINPPTAQFLFEIVRRFPIYSLEDPFGEKDFSQWQDFCQKLSREYPGVLVVADDLTVTDQEKIKKGAEKKEFSGVIIKANQKGTITQAVKAARLARRLGLKVVVSHRGQETNDDWVADLALKVKADFVKFGAPARGERVAKYNRLLKLTGY